MVGLCIDGHICPCQGNMTNKATPKKVSVSANATDRKFFFALPQKTFCMHACTHIQWRPQCRPCACLSGGVDSKLSFYFKISRALCSSCRCLPFNLEKMVAVSVTVFEENKVLCCGRLLRVSNVDMSLLSMLQGLSSTSDRGAAMTITMVWPINIY